MAAQSANSAAGCSGAETAGPTAWMTVCYSVLYLDDLPADATG